MDPSTSTAGAILSPTLTPANPTQPAAARPQPLPSSHPISLKLRSILTTRHSDAEEDERTKEALRALEAMYPATKSTKTDNRKRSNHLAPDTRPQVDLHRARACLETDARQQMLQGSTQFINILREVDASLTQVQNHIALMSDTCDQLDDRLTKASNGTRYLLDQAQGLQRQQLTTQQHKLILDLFLNKFTLPSHEADAISNPDVAPGSRLFAAMDHLVQIRTDSRALLEGGAGSGGGTRAGTDIMSNTSQQLEAAHQKIAKYLNFQFRQAPREGMDVSKTVRQCVTRLILAAREDLLRPSLQVLVSLRSTFLTTSFQQALTTGSSGSRPIELQAHDPLRYVGDMLAWIHQTVASEREFYGQLLSEKDNQGRRRVGQRRRNIDGSVDWTANDPLPSDDASLASKKSIYIRELLDRSLEGCCRPLSVRVEQTIRSQEGCITTFKLANLVHFYKVIMDQTIGSKASVSKVLDDISKSSYDAFFATLERHGQGLLRYIHPPEPDCGIPPALESSVAVLGELLQVHQSSLAEVDASATTPSNTSTTSGISTSISDFNSVVEHLITPMMSLVKAMEDKMATSRQSIRGKKAANTEDIASAAKRDSLVFRINCAQYISNTISSYRFVSHTREALEKTIDEARKELVQLDYEDSITTSSLSRIEATLDSPNCSAKTLTPHLQDFSAHLSTPSLLSPSLLQNLHSPTLRSSIHQEALHRVARSYADVYRKVVHVDQALGASMRSVEEVRLLFGVSNEDVVSEQS